MYEIIYKNTRHGYARIQPDGTLLVTIPKYLKNNEAFKQDLIARWELLLKKYSQKTQIQTHGSDFVLLFWEKVAKEELPAMKELKNYLKETLHEYSKPILDEYSEKIGYTYNKITIRKTKSKWWSCSTDQNIALNLSLIHLPTQFIKYVIIHEVCHLQHKNHGKHFWELVEKHCPNHKQIKKELRNFILD